MESAASLLVVIATYNEIENLPALLPAVLERAPNADILVIDDNSPDGTGEWCEAAAKKEPRLSCLHRSGKLGLGTAALAGFRYALEHNYAYVLTMDADFSHAPADIPAIWERMAAPPTEQADVVIGSRYVAGGAIKGWSWQRRVMSWGVNLAARWLLWLRVRDCSGAFRCYRIEMLAPVIAEDLSSSGYSYLEELLWRLSRSGATFAEVPITFVDRQRGQTKINWREAVAAVNLLARLGLRQWLKQS